MRSVHAGCGMIALTGLQKFVISKDYSNFVGLISVAHQAI
ncbi:hypothetical protein AC26_0488 [Escherichia coli 1-176-05_S3_C2]|nr:hypothetical protein AC26_0488 [Escherichia coli 1-176-05_S3_C2]